MTMQPAAETSGSYAEQYVYKYTWDITDIFNIKQIFDTALVSIAYPILLFMKQYYENFSRFKCRLQNCMLSTPFRKEMRNMRPFALLNWM